MQSKRPERLTLIAFIISTILGGNNAIAVRYSNVELSPSFGVGIRFAAADLFRKFTSRLPGTHRLNKSE